MILLVSVAFGQGLVLFNNRVTNSVEGRVYAPIYSPQLENSSLRLQGNGTNNGGSIVYTGSLLWGSGSMAALYAGPAGTTNENDLVLVATRRIGNFSFSGQGFIQSPGVVVAVPGVPPGSLAAFQVRAWNDPLVEASSWEQAVAKAYIPRGVSRLFTPPVGLGEPPFGYATLVGMESFCLYYPPGSPLITRQPSNIVALVGGEATFSVDINSEATPSFQWRQNATNRAEGTNQLLLITNLRHSDGGDYSVVVTSSSGAVTSQVARLTVPPILLPPQVALPTAIRVLYENTPNVTVEIQTSTDLSSSNWWTLGTVNNANIHGEFLDATATNQARCYRLRIQP